MFQKLNEATAFLERIITMVVKTDAPNGNHRFATMVKIRGIVRDNHFSSKCAPIVNDLINTAGAKAAEIIHDGISPAIEVGSLTTVGQNRIAILSCGSIL